MPKLNLADCHVSDAIRRLNPDLFGVGRLPAAIPKPASAQALVGSAAQHNPGKARGSGGAECQHRGRPIKTRPGGVYAVVTFVRHGRRLLDDDNLTASLKPIRDEVAAQLGIDDGDPRVRWECGQVETRGRQGVSVRISTT